MIIFLHLAQLILSGWFHVRVFMALKELEHILILTETFLLRCMVQSGVTGVLLFAIMLGHTCSIVQLIACHVFHKPCSYKSLVYSLPFNKDISQPFFFFRVEANFCTMMVVISSWIQYGLSCSCWMLHKASLSAPTDPKDAKLVLLHLPDDLQTLYIHSMFQSQDLFLYAGCLLSQSKVPIGFHPCWLWCLTPHRQWQFEFPRKISVTLLITGRGC